MGYRAGKREEGIPLRRSLPSCKCDMIKSKPMWWLRKRKHQQWGHEQDLVSDLPSPLVPSILVSKKTCGAVSQETGE